MGKYFGTDGVRGVANMTLTNEMVYRIGRYIAYYYRQRGKKKIVIAKDTRLSSSMFEASLLSGITASGCDAYLLGYTSTPALAYVSAHETFACGVMISASHNPYTDNGIKIFGDRGLKIGSEIEKEVEKYMDGELTIPCALAEDIGRVYNYPEGVQHYLTWLQEKYPLDLSSFRIALDLCNGGSITTAPTIFKALGGHVDCFNAVANGTNINDHCGSTHIKGLQEIMRSGRYDIGFAFDGDADRVLAVDHTGELVDGDALMYVLAKYYHEHKSLAHNTLVMTVMSNIGLKKALHRQGIQYAITAVGDKNVVDCMLQKGYLLGGEQSGHIINAQDSYFGDGVKTALNILEVMLSEKKLLRELCQDFCSYPQLLQNVKVAHKEEVLQDQDIQALLQEISTCLGENGRILVRPSGTEALIRVMVEAESEELCRHYVEKVVQQITKKGFSY